MILSKASLLIHKASLQKTGRRSLQCVKIEQNGTTVAMNTGYAIAVEPPDQQSAVIPTNTIAPRMELGADGLLIHTSAVAKAVKNLSKDRRGSLQSVVITRTSDPGKVGLLSYDAAGTAILNETEPMLLEFPEWKKIFSQYSSCEATRVCVNRKALIAMLSLVDSICSKTGNAFLEIDAKNRRIVVRGINGETLQRVAATCPTLDTEGKWLEPNQWETDVLFPAKPYPPEPAVKKKKTPPLIEKKG